MVRGVAGWVTGIVLPLLQSIVHVCSTHEPPAAGGEDSLVLTGRGEVYGFGSSIYGALGRPAEANVQKLPCRVPLGLHGMSIRMIAAGYDHALALAADGTVLSWGSIGKLAVAGFAFSNCYGGQLARSVKVFDSEYTYTQDQLAHAWHQPVATLNVELYREQQKLLQMPRSGRAAQGPVRAL